MYPWGAAHGASDDDGFRSDASRSPPPPALRPARGGDPSPARAALAPGYLGLVVTTSPPHAVQEVPPPCPR